MNLYEQLRADMAEQGEFWNCSPLDFEELFRKEDAVRGFILRFLGKHVGENVTDHLYQNDYKESAMKNSHTVYVFFLGALLRNILDEELAIESKGMKPYTFAYLWALISVGHDLGYLYEKGCKGIVFIPECWHSAYLKKIDIYGNKTRLRWYRNHGLPISYTVPSVSRHRVNGNKCRVNCKFECEEPIKFNNQTVIKKCRYNSRIKEKYFHYRLEKHGVLDHGIVGADVLYSGLLEWYIKNYRRNAKVFHSFENEQGEYFCCEQFKIFTYASNCVAAHSICMMSDGMRADYTKYGLQELLPETKRKISYKEDPLLFLFCIADAIAPAKRLKAFSFAEVLRGITIHYNKVRKQLLIGVSSQIAKSPYGKLYMQDVQQIGEWCDVRILVQIQE